jgi:hypothetical protein
MDKIVMINSSRELLGSAVEHIDPYAEKNNLTENK